MLVENPPAFPVEYTPVLSPNEAMRTRPTKVQYPGMSLRDWFAGQALASMIGEVAPVASTREGSLKVLARQCFDIADAMLAERAALNPEGSDHAG
jgi:hypothetical protein